MVALLFFACSPTKMGFVSPSGTSDSDPGDSDTGGSGTQVVLSGRAQAGPIQGGTVRIYSLLSDGSRGSLIGETTTDANGSYTARVPASSGPVLVVISG